MSQRALRHRLEYGCYRLLEAMFSVLPEWLALRFGAAIGFLAGSVLRIRRRDVDHHLKLAFPDRDERWRRSIARRSYEHLGREAAVLARMHLWSAEELQNRVRFVDFEPVKAAVDRDEGVVLLTAHLGNWEVAGAGIASLGVPLDVVGKGMANRRLEAHLFALRERLGMRVIEISDAPKDVLRALGTGCVVALLGDQNAHRHGVFLPFFGRLAATHRGTALFALRTEAPVFVGFAIREPGWSQRYVLAAQRLEYEVTGDVDRDLRSLLSSYHTALEGAIRSAPDQYFWQHRRWKTRPPEEQAS